MYYICKKRENIMGIHFGIMDTEDGLVEFYSPQEIISIVRDRGLKIEGVKRNPDTNKWTIKVLQPTDFRELSAYSESDLYSSNNSVSHRFVDDIIEIKYPESWGNFCDLGQDKLDLVLNILEVYLNSFLQQLRLPSIARGLDYIDGCDCVGYANISIPNTSYKLSIYANPSYDSQYGGTNRGIVKLCGIGCDVDGIPNKDIDECHFDSVFCKDLANKVQHWLNNLID